MKQNSASQLAGQPKNHPPTIPLTDTNRNIEQPLSSNCQRSGPQQHCSDTRLQTPQTQAVLAPRRDTDGVRASHIALLTPPKSSIPNPHRLQYWLLRLQALWLVIHKLLTIASQCVYSDEWANAVSQHGYSYVIQRANSILSNIKIYMRLFRQIPSRILL